MASGSRSCAARVGVVVDARHQMLDRFASFLAKQLLDGHSLVVIRCDKICISINTTNPSLHSLSPAKILWHTIREMLPHKTKYGASALARLKAYEGVPPPYHKSKRVNVRYAKLQPGEVYCLLSQLSSDVQWKELENKRKEKALVTNERRKQQTKLRLKTKKAVEEQLCSQLDVLALKTTKPR